jgi:hypothetical protein
MAITPRSLIHCPLHLGAVTILPDQSCSLIHFLLSNQLLQLPNSVELDNSRIHLPNDLKGIVAQDHDFKN